MKLGIYASGIFALLLLGCGAIDDIKEKIEEKIEEKYNNNTPATQPQAPTDLPIGKVYWRDSALMAITAQNKVDLIDLNNVKVGAINFDGIVIGINGVEIGYCQANTPTAYTPEGILVGECTVGLTYAEYFDQFKPTPPPTPVPPQSPKDGVNQPPFAHACADQSHTLSAGQTLTVMIGGPFSRDDGLIQPLSYSWVPINGGPSLVNANSQYPTFSVSCSTPYRSTHTYQLTVFDGEYSSSDTVNINIQCN
jgi:hypothetical protein